MRAGFVVLMENDSPDGMKLRVWKMITDEKFLHFILVMTDNGGSEEWSRFTKRHLISSCHMVLY